jgi:CheY-like chemotaxis protein
MVAKPVVAVVDDQLQDRDEIRCKAGHAFDVVECRDRAETLAAVANRDVRALVIDVLLDHDCGLELLADLRPRLPSVPALVTTVSRDPTLPGRAAALGARFHHKTIMSAWNVIDFFNEALCVALEPDPSLRRGAYAFAQRSGLHPIHTAAVIACNNAPTNETAAAWLEIPFDTFKSRVRVILKESKLTCMNEVRVAVLTGARTSSALPP